MQVFGLCCFTTPLLNATLDFSSIFGQFTFLSCLNDAFENYAFPLKKPSNSPFIAGVSKTWCGSAEKQIKESCAFIILF